MNFNFYEILSSVFKREPDSSVIITHENHSYTYQDIINKTAQIVNALKFLGVTKGDRVAIQIEKSFYGIFIYLACLRGGFILLPLNMAYTQSELKYFYLNAEPKLIICDPLKKTEKENLNTPVYTLDKDGNGTFCELVNKQLKECQETSIEETAAAVIMYTSGTTGMPKGAVITHGSLYHNTISINKVWKINRNDIVLHALPLNHVHGLLFSINATLLGRAKLLLLPRFDVSRVIENLNRATIFMGVPTYYTRLLMREDLNQSSCANIRVFISGSAPLLETTYKKFQEKTGHTLLERYGMTETGINSSNLLKNKKGQGSVGLPLPGVSIRIVDNNKKQLETGKVGNIEIKGKNLFKEYWKMPDKTLQAFTSDGYFKTGDLGKFDKDGYLYIVGRSKDMIITGGLNVYPKEIELTIDSIEGITESAVIGVPHRDYGEAVIALVVRNKSNLNENLIIENIRKIHANYKIPKAIFFTNELPKNSMGKVQKNLLREKYKNTFINDELNH